MRIIPSLRWLLTQRIVKAYGQRLLDVDSMKAEQQLMDALVQFETQLNNLKTFATTPELESTLAEVERLWTPFTDEASRGLDEAGLHRLEKMSEPLLVGSHQVVVQLEALSASPSNRLVNIAGRQRMLSQRIAKFYMMHAYGVQNEALHQELVTAAEEFRHALAELQRAPQNSPAINESLAEVQREWSVFEASFKLEGKGEYVPLVIALYSEKLLKKMHSITGLYADLANG